MANRQDPMLAACRRVLAYAEARNYAGYSKYDSLNSLFIRAICLNIPLLRLVTQQIVMRSPINLRPLLGVKKSKNPKGMGLFALAYLNLYAALGEIDAAERAHYCLEWLLEHRSPGTGYCWGYNFGWQSLYFYAPPYSPNLVVTGNVGMAFVLAYELLHERRYLDVARDTVEFITHDLDLLYDRDGMRAYSYIPGSQWVVPNVNGLAAALMSRLYRHTQEEKLREEAARIIQFVAAQQTPEGAWYYGYPPESSPVKHDNYHSGHLVDWVLDYVRCTGDERFLGHFKRGLEFYAAHLFLPDGAPKLMSDKVYPFDIHGAAQGIITFAKAAVEYDPIWLDRARQVAQWAIANMQSPKDGHFYYQKGRFWTKKFSLMRWNQSWMAYSLAALLRAEQKLCLEKG
jgi:hypothetical protein